MSDREPFVRVAGLVEAPFEQVRALVLDVRPGPVGGGNAIVLGGRPDLVLDGGPDHFTGTVRGIAAVSVDLVPDEHLVRVQGQWRFRGQTRVEPHPAGARVVREGFDIATRARWAVPFVRFGVAERQRAAAEEVLRRIGERLGVQTSLE
jgi:hypothetical protein